jgi:hypothetical protein
LLLESPRSKLAVIGLESTLCLDQIMCSPSMVISSCSKTEFEFTPALMGMPGILHQFMLVFRSPAQLVFWSSVLMRSPRMIISDQLSFEQIAVQRPCSWQMPRGSLNKPTTQRHCLVPHSDTVHHNPIAVSRDGGRSWQKAKWGNGRYVYTIKEHHPQVEYLANVP